MKPPPTSFQMPDLSSAPLPRGEWLERRLCDLGTALVHFLDHLCTTGFRLLHALLETHGGDGIGPHVARVLGTARVAR